MKRLSIFAFYHVNGIVKDYVMYWLKELRECSEHIIFVVNGNLSNVGWKAVQEYTTDVYIRQNVGLDAGAYKEVICDYLNEDLSKYDEVIFCNNSCWGPFVSLEKIFTVMQQRENSDFWGMCYTENNFANHIPGMFIVFRNSVIKSRLLQTYLKTYINEKTTSKAFVIGTYELGLFDFLVNEHHMKYDYYSDIHNLDVYKGALTCVKKYGFPILKRRLGEDTYFNRKKIISILAYVRDKTTYDIDLILDDLKSEYNIRIKREEITSDYAEDSDDEFRVFVANPSRKDILKFVKSGDFYIMGAGFYAVLTWCLYGRNNKYFQGFLISDDQVMPRDEFLKNKVQYFSTVNLREKNILVAIISTPVEVREKLADYHTLYLGT